MTEFSSPEQNSQCPAHTEQRQTGRLRHRNNLPANLAAGKRRRVPVDIPKPSLQVIDLLRRNCDGTTISHRRRIRAKEVIAQIKNDAGVLTFSRRTINASVRREEVPATPANGITQQVSVEGQRSRRRIGAAVGWHFVTAVKTDCK